MAEDTVVWGILGALDREVALLRAEMTVDRTEEALGATFAFGTLRGRRVAVACCGVGKVNAAACATWLLCARGCGLILNAGIAGAVGHGLRTLDVVASRELCFHDQDPVMLKYFPKRRLFAGDPALLTLCRRACARPGVLQGAYREGRIATGDRFVADRATRDRIVADCGGNVVSVQYDGSDPNMPISSCFLKLGMETRDAAQIEQIRSELAKAGFQLVNERT